MEVHQHTHTPRKKWTHYFWEFLMLFLAVTLGFFVENEREHYIEKTRAKELAKNLLEDLKSDTATMHQIRDRKSTRLNSSHGYISYAVFCLKKKKKKKIKEYIKE